MKIQINNFIANRTPEYIKHFCEERKKLMNVPITKERCRKAQIKRMLNGNIKINNSKPELKVKKLLEDLHINFIHQYYVKDIKHDYFADFCIPEKKIIIEADGDFWHHYPTGREIDTIRTLELTFNGYKVLRFWERDIHNNIGFIKNIILETIKI
jgi:very-short-patch-repair endonuclease